MRRTLLAATVLLAGCATTIDLSRRPPADWPQLEVVVQRVSEAEVKRICANENLLIGYACTAVYFDTRKCFIYLASSDPEVLAHERLHCLGYDHPGESTMRNAWTRWRLEH